MEGGAGSQLVFKYVVAVDAMHTNDIRPDCGPVRWESDKAVPMKEDQVKSIGSI